MNQSGAAEHGFTLIEALVAVALLVVCIGGALSGAASVGRFATAPVGPNRAAALAAGDMTARVAQDTWKYGQPPGALVPNGSWSTTYDGVALQVNATVSTAGELTVTVAYPPDPARDESGSVTMHTTLHALAPRPGTNVIRPGLVPAPAGAP